MRSPERAAFIAPLGLSALGFATHDPATLVARAARLVADGADLTLTRTTLALPLDRAIEDALAPYARIAAHVHAGALEIQILPAGSIASLAGLQRGDLVTAINGYALTTPDAELDGYRDVVKSNVAVFELIRGERRVVIEARFSPAPHAATAAR